MDPPRLTSSSYPRGTGDGDGAVPLLHKPKRSNAIKACLMCRKKKRRRPQCEGGDPCRHCLRSDVDCQWVERTVEVSPSSELTSTSAPNNPQAGRHRCLLKDGLDAVLPVMDVDVTTTSASPIALANVLPYGARIASHSDPNIAPFSQTPVFAGTPFYPTSPTAWSSATSALYPLQGEWGVDSTLISQLLKLTQSSDADFAHDQFDFDRLRRDVTQDLRLEGSSRTRTYTVSDASQSGHALYHECFAPAYPAHFPANTILDATIHSFPSTSHVVDDTQPQHTSEATWQCTREDFDDWFNFDLQFQESDSNGTLYQW
ncbi:hypothetical protein LXA43DRAFT_1068556 [Ganoderma leucocontextum]|nr:hypothetical protein LXA43DRAFT_1068556 [Ganoderma leucocontextum]